MAFLRSKFGSRSCEIERVGLTCRVMSRIEARPIHVPEIEAFLRLLCDSFDLDYSRAREIFLSEPSFDLDRKWALFVEGEIMSILTTTPLWFGSARTIGIAGVATRRDQRGQGYARQLLEACLAAADRAGEGAAILFARDASLYDQVGFTIVDQVVGGPIQGRGSPDEGVVVPKAEVRRLYGEWSGQDGWLRRDDLRWRVWDWPMRICEPALGGYVCYEGTTVREALLPAGLDSWPVPPGTEWAGLASVTRELGVPAEVGPLDLSLMVRGLARPPRMFMTDQF